MVLPIILFTAALFLAMIIQLAAKPKYTALINGCLLFFAAISGVLLYGYGFAMTASNPFLAVVRATLGVCGMFVGKNDLAAISDAPLYRYQITIIWFWITHMVALYLTASTAIATVGAEALKQLRIVLSRRGKLVLIYGTDQDALEYGASCNAEKGVSVVFVSSAVSSDAAAAISKMGAVLRSDASAVSPNGHFLKSVGIRPGKRLIEIYALQQNEAENLHFAEQLLSCFEAAGIKKEQTSISILGSESALAGILQGSTEKYGFGCVSVFRRHELSARQLVLRFPPCNYISFGEDGTAAENFDCVIIGFGRQGQSVLRQLVMNGQFEGSHFHAAVFDPRCMDAAGYLQFDAPELFRQYDIEFHNCDARSKEFFNYLQQNRRKIRYIVVCAGPEAVNYEIAAELMEFSMRHSMNAPIFQCWHFGIRAQESISAPVIRFPAYTHEILSASYADTGAMLLNYRYVQDSGITPWQAWMQCDYFSRMSSRASADFIPAFLKITGKTADEAIKDWQLSPELSENLAKTEHLRWNAFHFAMGFSPMTDEEWQTRADAYRKELQDTGRSKTRISKNLAGRTHACLVSWDALKELDLKETAVTGKLCDYQQADRNNIEALPELLQAIKEYNR